MILSVALGSTVRSLLGLAAAAVSVREIYGGFSDAIGDGKALTQLSRRTGESVRDLVVLRQAFENAGLGMAYVGTAANLLDRVLSGTTAQGLRTQDVFNELGLTIEQMRGLSFTAQLQLLGSAFAKLPNQAARAGAAMQLFGRYAGGQMLQLLADPDAFTRAEEQAGRLGHRMQQDAAIFNEVAQRLSVIKLRLEEMFAAATEQLLPALHQVASALGGMNLSAAGSFLGIGGAGIAAGIVGAFSFNKIDTALYGFLGKMEDGTTKSIVRGISNAMGEAAAWTPVFLAGSVALAIVAGVVAAWNDKAVHAIVSSEGKTKAVETTAGAIQSEDDRQTQLAAAKSQYADVKSAYDREDSKWIPYDDVLSSYFTQLGQLQEQIDKLSDPGWAKVTEQTNIAAAALGKMKETLAPLVAELPKLREENDKNSLEGMDLPHQAMVLNGRHADLDRQIAAPTPAGLTSDEADARRLDLENRLFDIKKQEAEVNAKLSGAPLKLAIHANLPADVEARVESWLVKRWWTENTRPAADGYYTYAPS